jgi:hypothetical protein
MVALYLALLAIELYWNLFDWRPRADLTSFGACGGITFLVVGIWFLAQARGDAVTRTASLLACLALFALGVHAGRPEPPGQGLFARDTPSPFWYRGSRLIVMTLPAAFWIYGLRRNRRSRSA